MVAQRVKHSLDPPNTDHEAEQVTSTEDAEP